MLVAASSGPASSALHRRTRSFSGSGSPSGTASHRSSSADGVVDGAGSVAKLGRFTVKRGGGGAPETCAVCLCDFGGGARPGRVVRLGCGHAFCAPCLARCAAHDLARCPVCRREHCLDPQELERRLGEFRGDYRAWRQGGASGARGELGAVKRAPAADDKRPRPVTPPADGAPAAASDCVSPEHAVCAASKAPEEAPERTDAARDDATAAAAAAAADEDALPDVRPRAATASDDAAIAVACAAAAVAAAAALAPTLEFKPPVVKVRVPRPSTVWLAGVVLTAQETILVVMLFSHALFSAAARELLMSRKGEPVLWPFVLFAAVLGAVGTTDGAKAFVDAHVPKAKLNVYIFRSYAAEAVGLFALFMARFAPGVPAVLRHLTSLAAVLVVTQCGQIGRIQRKTTGTGALDAQHLALLTITAVAHHLASFVRLPNLTVAVFVTAWRCVSISGHAMEWLDVVLHKPPQNFFLAIGWLRYYCCVAFFQPVAIAAVLAQAAGADACAAGLGASPFSAWLASWLVPLGRGLVANSTGHAAYLLFRAARLCDMHFNATLPGTPVSATINKAGRATPFVQIEIAMLTVAGLAMLLVPANC